MGELWFRTDKAKHKEVEYVLEKKEVEHYSKHSYIQSPEVDPKRKAYLHCGSTCLLNPLCRRR